MCYAQMLFCICYILIVSHCQALGVSSAKLLQRETFRSSETGDTRVDGAGVAKIPLRAEAEYEVRSREVMGEQDSIATYFNIQCWLGNKTQINVTTSEPSGEKMLEQYRDVIKGHDVVHPVVMFTTTIQVTIDCAGEVAVPRKTTDGAETGNSSLLAEIADLYNFTMPTLRLAPENTDVTAEDDDVDSTPEDYEMDALYDSDLIPTDDLLPVYKLTDLDTMPVLHCLPYLLENVNISLADIVEMLRANRPSIFNTGALMIEPFWRINLVTIVNILASTIYGALMPSSATLRRRYALPVGAFLLLLFVRLCVDLHMEADYHACYLFVWTLPENCNPGIHWFMGALVWICFPTSLLYLNLLVWEGRICRISSEKKTHKTDADRNESVLSSIDCVEKAETPDDSSELVRKTESCPASREATDCDDSKVQFLSDSETLVSSKGGMKTDSVPAELQSGSRESRTLPEVVLNLSEVICCLVGLSFSIHGVAVQMLPITALYLHLVLVFIALSYHYRATRFTL